MSILAIGLFVYLGWATLLFIMQRSMMFPGKNLDLPALSASQLPGGVESIRLPFFEGSAEAWFIGARENQASPAVVFAHGNAELIGDGLRDARSLTDLGVSVLLVEYPGYGRSDGDPSRRSIGEVFLAAYDWLAVHPDVDKAKIVGFGRSLGSGAITDLAGHRPLKALVLQSPFISAGHFARRHLLPGFLVRDRFNNLAALGSFPGPVLLIHGTRDRIIPHTHSERLARASEQVQLVSLDCGHNDCPPNWADYVLVIRDFLVRSAVLSAESRAAN
ncbi:MAG: alpha/beta hydrolase [Gemmatimonadota bacterium]